MREIAYKSKKAFEMDNIKKKNLHNKNNNYECAICLEEKILNGLNLNVNISFIQPVYQNGMIHKYNHHRFTDVLFAI